MSAPINTPIAFVMALARSDCATRGCLNAAVISGCWAAFVFTPVSETPVWCRFKCVAMLDVFPLSYGFLVPQCLHTVTVLSTNLFPSSLYLTGKPNAPIQGNLNDAGRSSSIRSSARHDYAVCGLNMRTTFFFHKSIHGSRVCRTEDSDPNGSRINDDPLHHYCWAFIAWAADVMLHFSKPDEDKLTHPNLGWHQMFIFWVNYSFKCRKVGNFCVYTQHPFTPRAAHFLSHTLPVLYFPHSGLLTGPNERDILSFPRTGPS